MSASNDAEKKTPSQGTRGVPSASGGQPGNQINIGQVNIGQMVDSTFVSQIWKATEPTGAPHTGMTPGAPKTSVEDSKRRLFLCYAREDQTQVHALYHRLSDEGLAPWMDCQDILPGKRWEDCIQQAIREAHLFLACLSLRAVDKRGFLQKELKAALDILDEKLPQDIYIIPVRLEECPVPERLKKIQWVDLFDENGWPRLIRAARQAQGFDTSHHA